MIAPKDWTEPIVELSYETRGVVLQGTLGLAFFNETLYFKTDEGFVIPKNTKVRIFNAGSTTLKILEILRPAYKADKVKTHQSFR
jgi:mannose-6-phosphate isomerase-like protein (cupin superfamily)